MNNTGGVTPFQSSLMHYLEVFESQEGYFVGDIRNQRFFATTPENNNVNNVLLKISAINDKEVENNPIIEELASHIVALHIDERLNKGDWTLVEEIAHLNVRHKEYHPLHFASTYCCFHKPNLYPIYSEQHLEFYKRYIAEQNLPLDSDKIEQYPVFAHVLEDLMNRWNLKGRMDYLHFRKFLWLYANNILKES